MNDILKTTFLKKQLQEIEFEIFYIRDLFNRYKNGEFDLKKTEKLDFFLILFITKGSGIHKIDFQPVLFSEGDIIFVSKNQIQSYDIDNEYDGYITIFTESFLTKNILYSNSLADYRLFNYYFSAPIIKKSESKENIFVDIFEKMLAEYTKNEYRAKEEIIRHLLSILLLQAERIKQKNQLAINQSKYFDDFIKFNNFLENNFTITRNVKDYADKLCVTEKKLNEITKNVMNKTTKLFIDERIILESKRLLSYGKLTVKDISYKLGFDEPTNFVKFFKRYTNITPSDFKKSI